VDYYDHATALFRDALGLQQVAARQDDVHGLPRRL
jgi:hypothetical protein